MREERAVHLSTLLAFIPLHKPSEAAQLYFFVRKLPTGHSEYHPEGTQCPKDPALHTVVPTLTAVARDPLSSHALLVVPTLERSTHAHTPGRRSSAHASPQQAQTSWEARSRDKSDSPAERCHTM